MSRIRIFTDEDIYGAVSGALRRAGFDAISTPETERPGESDESQLQFATDQGRVLVTFNVAHFARLHSEWTREERQHAGIVVSNQRPIGDLLRRLLHFAQSVDGDAVRGRLEFLSDW